LAQSGHRQSGICGFDLIAGRVDHFHDYGVLWTPDRLVISSTARCRTSGPDRLRDPAYMIVNLAMKRKWFQGVICRRRISDTVEFKSTGFPPTKSIRDIHRAWPEWQLLLNGCGGEVHVR
jgi:hypothetical protein